MQQERPTSWPPVQEPERSSLSCHHGRTVTAIPLVALAGSAQRLSSESADAGAVAQHRAHPPRLVKLNLRDRTQAVVLACKTGLVTAGFEVSQGGRTADDDGLLRLSLGCCGEWRLGGR